jgi:hypothetical protein
MVVYIVSGCQKARFVDTIPYCHDYSENESGINSRAIYLQKFCMLLDTKNMNPYKNGFVIRES